MEMIVLLMGWFIFWIGGWLFFSVLVGAYAYRKERNGIGWFFLSLLISPLIAFIIVLVAGPSSSSLKKCPKCAENVKVEAQICRFCNYEFPSSIDKQKEEKKSMSKFSNQGEYEKWRVERLRETDKRGK